MKKIPAILCVTLIVVMSLQAQFTQTPQQKARQDSIRKISEQDHKQLMGMMGIASLRQGANGSDPNAANAATTPNEIVAAYKQLRGRQLRSKYNAAAAGMRRRD